MYNGFHIQFIRFGSGPDNSRSSHFTSTERSTSYAVDDKFFTTHTVETTLRSRIRQKLQTHGKSASYATMTPSKPSQPVHAKDRPGTADVSGMQRMLGRYTASLPQKPGKAMPPTSPPKTLAIVGSTGFLGPYILASLLREHPECKIICFNRSDGGEQRTMSALQDIMGDISSARQRLTFLVTDIAGHGRELHHDPISETIPQVQELVFNAWDPNWGKPLSSFESLLEALRKVVDLVASAAGHPRITFVSSICAVVNWPLRHPNQPMIPEEVIWDCESTMPNGYGQSKCVAEQLLAKAHESAKLRVNIVRAGQIGGPTSSKHCTWPRQGWLYSIIRSSAKLGVFPKHVQPLDWIPVDALAQGVANCIKRPPTSDGLQVFNMVHPHPAAWSLLHEGLRTRFGISTQMVDLPDWLERMEQGELRIHGFLSTQGGGRETNMSFENTRALEVLPPMSPINIDLLAMWLQGWELGLRAKM
jgi:thioester reductase-like protein